MGVWRGGKRTSVLQVDVYLKQVDVRITVLRKISFRSHNQSSVLLFESRSPRFLLFIFKVKARVYVLMIVICTFLIDVYFLITQVWQSAEMFDFWNLTVTQSKHNMPLTRRSTLAAHNRKCRWVGRTPRTEHERIFYFCQSPACMWWDCTRKNERTNPPADQAG